jgi:hypothetical protein
MDFLRMCYSTGERIKLPFRPDLSIKLLRVPMKNGKGSPVLPAQTEIDIFKCFLDYFLGRFILHPVHALERGKRPLVTYPAECPCSLEPDAGVVIPEGTDEVLHGCRVFLLPRASAAFHRLTSSSSESMWMKCASRSSCDGPALNNWQFPAVTV